VEHRVGEIVRRPHEAFRQAIMDERIMRIRVGIVVAVAGLAAGVAVERVAVGGLVAKGPSIEPYKMRGVILITASILVFAACIRPLGLVIASFCCMMTCAAAAEDIKWRESILWAAVLTAFCSVLFPYGLNLPFQLWPRF